MIPSSWSLPKKDFECSAIICQMRGPLANVSNCSGGWAARELLSRSLQNFGLLPSLICPLGRSVFFFSTTSCCISWMALHLLLLIFDCFGGCGYMWFRHVCYGRTISLKCLVLSHYSLCVCVCVCGTWAWRGFEQECLLHERIPLRVISEFPPRCPPEALFHCRV